MTDQAAPRLASDSSHIGWDAAEFEGSIAERLTRVVAAVPDRIAASGSDGTFSYAELDASANRIANAVVARLGTAEEPVGVVAANTAEMVVALVALLKAGKVFLLLDPSYPRERLEATLADAGCSLVLVTGEVTPHIAEWLGPDIAAVHTTDTIHESDQTPAVVSGPDSLISLVYTSGSTGRPKGVPQTHRNLLDLIRWTADRYHISSEDRIGLPMSVAFGPSPTLIINALLEGASAHMFDLKARGVAEMSQWMRRERITITYVVPTVIRRWLAGPASGEGYSDLRVIMAGGEPILRGDAEAVFSHVSEHCVLRAGYGSSEAYLMSVNDLTAADIVEESVVPVGLPVAGKRIWILGDDGQELPPGEAGQIAVTSPYLTPGYWRNEEATSRVFRPDPAGGAERTYLTGDLGRFRNGMLEHLGRMDDLVKIRGKSVILSEVEAAMLELPGVAEAAAAAHMGPDGSPRLVGYLVPRDEAPLTNDLRKRLRERLLDHMVPSTFVTMERLPLLPVGKVDRRALPAPDGRRPDQAASFLAPRSPAERAIAGILAHTLSLDRVGVHDNVFDLGIDSLHVTAVAAKVGKALGVAVPPAALLAYPTTAALAAAIAGGELASVQDSLVFVRGGDDRTPLFCVHGGGGGVFYLQPLSRYLAPEQGVYGLQAEGYDGIPGPFRTVEELAVRYLDEIRSVQSRGPYLLGGLSFGGKIAYEMARLLVEEGEVVALLVMLDTELPLPGLGYRRGFRRRFQRIEAMGPWRGTAHLFAGVRARLAAPAKRFLIRRYLRQRRPLPERFGIRRYYFLDMMADPAYLAYDPPPYSGRLVVVGTEGTADEHRTTWGALAGGDFHVHEIATDHEGLVSEPRVRELAQILQQHLDEAHRDIRGRAET